MPRLIEFIVFFWRRFDVRPVPSAACPRESVLPIRLRPDFSMFSRVMRAGLFTGMGAKRPGSVLSRPIFSGPDDCVVLVNSVQVLGKVAIFEGRR